MSGPNCRASGPVGPRGEDTPPRVGTTQYGLSTRSLLCVLVLLHASCVAVSGPAREADRLAQRGLWREAVDHYVLALEADPRDPRLSKKLLEARHAWVELLLPQIEHALLLDRLEEADGLYQTALANGPGALAKRPFRSKLAVLWSAKVIEATGAGDLRLALHAAERTAALSDPGSEAQSVLLAARHAYARELSAASAAAQRDSHPGLALLTLLSLKALDPERAALPDRLFDARLALRASLQFNFGLEPVARGPEARSSLRALILGLKSLEGADACPGFRLSRATHLILDPKLSPENAVGLLLEVKEATLRNLHKKSLSTHRYRAGTRRVRNPARKDAVAHRAESKRALDDAVQSYKDALQQSDEAETKLAEAGPDEDPEPLQAGLAEARSIALGAKQAAMAAARELDAAKKRLAVTPKKIDEAVERSLQLPVDEVTRVAILRVQIRANRLGSGELLLAETLVEASAKTTDKVSPAEGRAGLAADPLVFPDSDEALRKKVQDTVGTALATKALQLCQGARAAIIEKAEQTEEDSSRETRSELWVRALFSLPAGGTLPPNGLRFFQQQWPRVRLKELQTPLE